MSTPRVLRPSPTAITGSLFGLSVSVFGTGMWAVAMVYQVIALGGGPIQLSLVATCACVGLLAFVLIGGRGDRLPRRRLIISVEAANLVAITAVTLLAMTGLLQLWHLSAAAFLLGVGAAFFFPAYSAILPGSCRPSTCWQPMAWKAPCARCCSRPRALP